MWQTISSKEVFSHPRLSLIEDEVVLANGKKTHYLTYKEAGNGATIICRDPEGRILVQKEYSYPPNETIFQFPGGLVPRTEDAAIGANRELM
ncbi:NUDIX domain-containing protein, partial [Patescibacteria group bacterium]|nr:NUDIX domain-containing protein [Patescibacteria group bacterium]